MAQVMLIFNESSGTSITNYGSASNPVVETEAGGTAQYNWQTDQGSYDGYLQIQEDQGSNQTIVDLSALTLPTEGDINMAFGVAVHEYDTRVSSIGYLHSMSPDDTSKGGVQMDVDEPTTGGGSPNDFNLILTATDDDNTVATTDVVFQDLTFSTFYQIALHVDSSTGTLRVKLDSGTPVNGTSAGFPSTNAWFGHGGKIGRGNSFAHYYGIKADLYYWYEDRGTDIAWSDTDLSNVNSDPQTYLSGWPSGVSITSVSVDDAYTDGDTGIAVVGTGFV
jgi:hypothetical protein